MNVSNYGTRLHKVDIVVGNDVILPCNTSHEVPVVWLYFSEVTANQSFVNVNDDSNITYVQNRSDGDYSLLIRNAQLSHAGWYVCIENEGTGLKHTILLNISGMFVMR